MSLIPPRIAALTEPPPPRALPLYRPRPLRARPRALTSARTRPPLRPPFPALSRELCAAQWPAREAFPELSRDFEAPGPRGVSGGTARFLLPPVPPGSDREESDGELSRDHKPPHHHHTACAALSFCSPPSRKAPRARAAETPLKGGGAWVTWVGTAAILSLPPRRAVAQRVMAAWRGGGAAAPRTHRPRSPAGPACGSTGLRPSPVLAAQRHMAVSCSPQHTMASTSHCTYSSALSPRPLAIKRAEVPKD